NGNAPSAITLSAGQTVTCTFTNTKRGHIIVQQATNPSGDPQSFNFTTTGTGYAGFSLIGGGPHASGPLVPGRYSVAETVPACCPPRRSSDLNGNAPSAITLSAGQTVTCTFTNTKQAPLPPPPTVLARTIGFWMNWASCSSSSGR